MELSEKLQQLRRQKNLTQEELAEILFVSRTAISKWESGRGYPSIDSLKAIAAFYSVSIDELLSSKELLAVAEKDNRQKFAQTRDLVFGLLDCSVAMFLFLPLFGQKINGVIYEVALPGLTQLEWYIMGPYLALTLGTILWGIATLALQRWQNAWWIKWKVIGSAALSTISALLFMLSLQPYAAMFTFLFLLIKGIFLLKRP